MNDLSNRGEQGIGRFAYKGVDALHTIVKGIGYAVSCSVPGSVGDRVLRNEGISVNRRFSDGNHPWYAQRAAVHAQDGAYMLGGLVGGITGALIYSAGGSPMETAEAAFLGWTVVQTIICSLMDKKEQELRREREWSQVEEICSDKAWRSNKTDPVREMKINAYDIMKERDFYADN